MGKYKPLSPEQKIKYNEYRRKWRDKNREKVRADHKKWRKGRPDVRKNASLKRHHGISLTEYKSMLDQQGGKCAICKKDGELFKRSLAVDHCHKTGKIRGLLCMNCNKGIGHLQDSIEFLESAILYLKERS